ncbi:MCE family protein [Mycolicibacterium stellerae]|uniref:MCE family protein n=1 Tax=Mycolicibacterium stellerae TaxID=2358193 RepID=UPI000F0B43D6|nr:MCE family protein [Mycolicibacterium stellerae]
MTKRQWQITAAFALVLVLVGGTLAAVRAWDVAHRTRVTAYFTNATGIFPGDDVRILGVRVGAIETIEAQPQQVKMTFWVDDKYKVPAEAKAVILSPSLISARAIQLVPAYTSGPVMATDAVIPRERTAVPVEWDDLRIQLQKLVETLQPTQPGGVSTLGSLVNTAADNLRGEGANIHDTIIKLSQAFSTLGDHSRDVFSTVKDLSTVVSALQDSTELMRALNQNLAATTTLLDNQPDEVGEAVADINDVVSDVQSFVKENREPVGVASDKLSSISVALNQSLDDIKQTLHIAPTQIANFTNIYPVAQGGFRGAFSLNNFQNPIQFLCGAIQAASTLGAEQAAKLCVQYLAPIIKNRQYNFLPFGANPIVGAAARPNEITYSEDWLRPDYVPPATPQAAPADGPAQGAPDDQPPQGETVSHPPADTPPLPAEAPPDASNLHDLMVPAGAGS